MKKVSTLFVSMFILLFVAGGAQAGTVSDNFNDGDADGWIAVSQYASAPGGGGNWRVEDGIVVQDVGRDGHKFLYEKYSVSNQTVETELLWHDNGSAGMTIWHYNIDNWVMVAYPAAGVGIVVYEKWCDYSPCDRFANLTREYYTLPVTERVWQNLKLDTNSLTGEIAIYLDDIYIDTHTVGSQIHRTGLSGFNSSNAGGSFDNFVLTSEDIPPSDKSECKEKGWKNWSMFDNQGDCMKYINENNKCDLSVPQDFSLVQDAVDAASSGQTVCLGEGIFTEGTIDINDKDVSLIGVGADETIIDYENIIGSIPDVWHPEKHSAISMINVSQDAKIEGLTIRNAHFYGIHLVNASPVIKENKITQNGLGIKVATESAPNIDQNTISENDGYGIVNSSFVGGYEISQNFIDKNGLVTGGANILFNPVYLSNYHYPEETIIVKKNTISGGIRGIWEANGKSNFGLVENVFDNDTNVVTTTGIYDTEEEINLLENSQLNKVIE